MIQYLVLLSCIGFLAFLVLGRYRKYPAIIGWVCIVLALFASIPEYIAENNFLYPLMAVLSVPFLLITIKYLLKDDPTIFSLSRAAAVAFLIYAPFEYIPALGDWLIAVVVDQVVAILSALGYPATLTDWNIISRNNLRVEIILACTGIQSIAIMLGVAAAVPTTLKQKMMAFILIAPTIYVLNLFRNVFVILAYTGQWFPYYPEIASNGEFGYESFFWAHNVIAEFLALVLLIAIAYGLFRIIPDLADFAEDLSRIYIGEVRAVFGKGR
ncbi:MAG TPA: archaeosortase A [Methanoregulaceae archaeon]|nr:archaeosortase A [Methanoregulaceae archaeon]HPD76488.1 archaeosortase A [Methanoregulaceae archaeon]HRY75422.1 archaeosortase A [Methanoregulaceae archaeon]